MIKKAKKKKSILTSKSQPKYFTSLVTQVTYWIVQIKTAIYFSLKLSSWVIQLFAFMRAEKDALTSIYQPFFKHCFRYLQELVLGNVSIVYTNSALDKNDSNGHNPKLNVASGKLNLTLKTQKFCIILCLNSKFKDKGLNFQFQLFSYPLL